MKKVIIIFILAYITFQAPWNYVCPQPQIATVQITNLPLGSNFNKIFFNTTLNQPMIDSAYQFVTTFASLSYSQFQMRLRIGIGGSVINGNSIQLFVFGTYSGMFLTIIKITYLVIPSEYSNLITSISVTSDLLNLNISAGANIEIYKTLPLQLSSLDFICTSYLTSIDILMNVASLTLGIDYSLTILNTTTYKLKISNIGQNEAFYYLLDRIIIIAYPSRFPSGSSAIFNTIYYPALSIINDFITQQNTIVGIVSFFSRNGSKFQTIVSNRIANISYGNQTQISWVVFTLNIFSNGQCCSFNPFIINSLIPSCSNQCSLNSGSEYCFLCKINSFFNSTTNSCIDCPSQSYLNHTNGFCVICQDNFFLDSSSNRCRPCPSFTFLNSNFICQPCPDNSYFDFISKICKSCGLLLLNKTTGKCDKCPDGQYLNLTSLTCQILNSNQTNPCSGGRNLHYIVEIEHIARKNPSSLLISTETCKARILFNGEVIASIIPSSYYPQRSYFPVILKEGDNLLTIQSTSYQDTLGLIIGRVKVSSLYNFSDLIINGDFRSSISTSIGSYPGWYCAKPQIGFCTEFNENLRIFNYTDFSKCIELQSDTNQNYSQIIKIPSSLKCSLLAQAQKLIQTTINRTYQADAVRLNLVTPKRMYFSEVTFQYESCAFDCYTCIDSNVCSSCNSTIDFRILNKQTQRCDPLPGYSNNGNLSQAQRCVDFFCTSCFINYSLCMACQNGSTLYNNICVICQILNCLSCHSSNSCSNCIPGYSLLNNSCFSCSIDGCQTCSDKQKCAICSSGKTLFNQSCIECHLQNCVVCNQTNICISCSEGYSLAQDLKCVSCSISECISCQIDGICSKCIDHAILQNNTCICKAGYWLNQTVCIQFDLNLVSQSKSQIYIGTVVLSLVGLLVGLVISISIKLFWNSKMSIKDKDANLKASQGKMSDEVKHKEDIETILQLKAKIECKVSKQGRNIIFENIS